MKNPDKLPLYGPPLLRKIYETGIGKNMSRRILKLYQDGDPDWERIARTETKRAFYRAQIESWKRMKIKKTLFVAKPNACLRCRQLAGEYEIDSTPIPGVDTHPDCYCTITAKE